MLIQWYRMKGKFTSGVLWCYWLIWCIGSFIPFYSKIVHFVNVEKCDDVPEFATSTVYFILCCVQFILACISDANDETRKRFASICPEHICSFSSYLMFSWFTDTISLGYKKELSRDDLWNLGPNNTSKENVPAFEADWDRAVAKWRHQKKNSTKQAMEIRESSESAPLIESRKPAKEPPLSFFKLIVKHHGGSILLALTYKFFYDWIQFLCPAIQGLLMDLVMSRTDERAPGMSVAPAWQGYVLTIVLLLTQVVMSILFQHMWYMSLQVGFRIRAAVIAILYKKALKLSSEAKEKTTTGELVNLMSVDAQRMQDVFMNLWAIPSAPLQVIICLWQLYACVGPSLFLGFGIMVISMPIVGRIAMSQKAVQTKQMKLKDTRVKMTNEVLSGIKVIKLYAWEPSFEEKIAALRAEEMKTVKTFWRSMIAQFTIISSLINVVTAATYTMYIFIDPHHILTPTAAYITLTLFNLLRGPFFQIPMALSTIAMASVSVNRITNFFKTTDLSDEHVEHNENCDVSIRISNGSFSWSPTSTKTLHNINFEVPTGSLTAVVGQVGSGKSSLLAACVGDMHKLSGRVVSKGSMAFVSQQAWIQNGTVRDNILFGKPYERNKYNKILKAVALTADLKILQKGDLTMIGEKGINLSGGQKQRVSLARACYSESDLYLLDDPLSAVDAHVGKHIFENVIGPNGLLKDKTRILVTHGLQWLPEVDSISVLTEGRITETGTYQALIAEKGVFAQLIDDYVLSEDAEPVEEVDEQEPDNWRGVISLAEREHAQFELSASMILSEKEGSMALSALSRNTEPSNLHEENLESGKVTAAIYKYYLKAIGIFWTSSCIISLCLFMLSTVGATVWLTTWTNDERFLPATTGNYTTEEKWNATNYYLGIYWLLVILRSVAIFFVTAALAQSGVSASKYLHEVLLKRVMRLQMVFFDTKPLGQILNRFSKDIDAVDNVLGGVVLMVSFGVGGLGAALIIIVYGTPAFLLLVIPFGFCYYLLQRYFIMAMIRIKRWEAVTRSPIFTHFTETVLGAQTIRAFGVQERFIQTSEDMVEENNLFFYAGWAANRWLGVRLQIVSGILVGVVAGTCVLSTQVPLLHSYINSSIAGVALTFALLATMQLTLFAKNLTDLETNAVSIERIKEYTELPLEAEWTNDNPPPRQWPAEGEIQFSSYSVKYRPELQPVLKGIDITISPQEKIGIVGRTGAGKSTTAVALFRLIEASDGSISIDGINIRDIGLHQLRNRLTILPQDPTVFAGNMRDNLDPFNQYSDDKIWEVLEQSYLKEYVEKQPEKLEYDCGEGGKNLSVGQRQLVCLARALLRKTKILVLDEATAAVDLETDDLIQKTIRTAFTDCTILTIAHRLNTIMDSDRILVLDRGMVAEFDTPENLLRDDDSVFSGMAEEAGLKTAS
ncbi:multidrug resistance-associated protein 1-like [Watersipora subatra]|uniref:multidrug resistance-associated protein 1-like n=1 Tax=Watersipora subatra TaxID=2589382 RepID=UPI00355C4A97